MLSSETICKPEQDPGRSPEESKSIDQSIVYKMAERQSELEQSYRLLHDVYVASGYLQPQPSGMRLSIYNALPNVRTFVAKDNGEVISCITFIPDSPLGLPMDQIYCSELSGLRLAGCRLAEISGFVTKPECVNQGMTIFLNFVKNIYAQALVDGIEYTCIAINPCHMRFYVNALFFTLLGGLKRYSAVNYAPSYALKLDSSDFFKHARAKTNRIYRFLGQKLGNSLMNTRLNLEPVMSEKMLHYFFCQKSKILPRASYDVYNLLKAEYPRYDFGKILMGGNGF